MPTVVCPPSRLALTRKIASKTPLHRPDADIDMDRVVVVDMAFFDTGRGVEPNFRIPDLHTLARGDGVLVYVADWSTPAARMHDLSVVIALAERVAPARFTVVVPFMPSGTMERETDEGVVATASCEMKMLEAAMRGAASRRIVLVDPHTLHQQFYAGGISVAVVSVMPQVAATRTVDVFVFPDEGAHKRYARYFPTSTRCEKVRGAGGERRVRLVEPEAVRGKRVCVIDDLTRTGNTLGKCADACYAAGATHVSAFVVHRDMSAVDYAAFVRTYGDRVTLMHADTAIPIVTEEPSSSTSVSCADVVARNILQ